MHVKVFVCLFIVYETAKKEIQICSNTHETGLVFKVFDKRDDMNF